MVLFPVEFDIGPDVQRIASARVAAFAKAAVEPQFQTTVVGEENRKVPVTMANVETAAHHRLPRLVFGGFYRPRVNRR